MNSMIFSRVVSAISVFVPSGVVGVLRDLIFRSTASPFSAFPLSTNSYFSSAGPDRKEGTEDDIRVPQIDTAESK